MDRRTDYGGAASETPTPCRCGQGVRFEQAGSISERGEARRKLLRSRLRPRGRQWALSMLVLVTALMLMRSEGVYGPGDRHEEQLIGWQGETYNPKGIVDDGSKSDKLRAEGESKPWVQVLSWSPRAFVYHNFLSPQEVRHILQLAAPQMKRSTVVGPNNTGVLDNIRTSAGTFLNRNHDEVITRVEQRLAVWSQLPASFQEDMQVLRYGPTNKYGAHMDGLERVMSVLIYLVAPEEGGETAFPMSNGWLHPEMGEPAQGTFSACAKGHVAYKPKSGDALLFYDLKPSYKEMDPMSTHTGCPVVEGVKWNAVKWIHGKPFRGEEYEASLARGPAEPLPDPGVCANLHDMCEKWADSGECTNNPGYMLGSNSGRGACRRACRECQPCDEGDAECIHKNREAAGYMSFEETEFKGLLD